ncbi:hypothetical protein ACWD3Z_36815 [Streptomyces sp. NPDC002740]
MDIVGLLVPDGLWEIFQTVHRRFTDWSTARVWAKLRRVAGGGPAQGRQVELPIRDQLVAQGVTALSAVPSP